MNAGHPSPASPYPSRLSELFDLQKKTPNQPYSILHRLNLARAYKNLGYPDLAASDAYKALLLVDEVAEGAEFHEEALEAALNDLNIDSESSKAKGNHEEKAINIAQTDQLMSAYDILIPCLIDCGCLRSAFSYNMRALKAFPNTITFPAYQTTLIERLQQYFEAKGENFNDADIQKYPDKGRVRRELYPWNDYEPDRFAAEVLQFLNDELDQIAPKLEVKVAELPLLSESSTPNAGTKYVKQLGVFAKVDIPPGEEILKEKSLLTAVSRLHDSYCDACSVPLSNQQDAEAEILSCEECNEVFFCSQECHDLAQDTYHPSLCGVDIDRKVSASEAADSLHTLLVIRAIALAETQDVHPLELKEVRYIWGDYHGRNLEQAWQPDVDAFGSLPRTLPFSFEANVLRPLHILEKMDVNIFEQSHRYDTWVFNTLYAKLRGTASARQGLDGRPEIGAVHPMWCLTNHSCDPNVSWEWCGSMRFWTRTHPIEWKGRDASKSPGLKKGEEVFSHYCDVRLPVKERREWAVGALGGLCMCERCVWEASTEEKKEKDKHKFANAQ
ncbi:hypothetical protein CC80DRAFT_480519 [Byssothecium circinans]|uniref:SET domain-containing protein n=1 Tax=Byssothecium circinans TaxID=147558 RepID=A0A6A5TFW0_9PLEO|nr:hypothetical protein CC80DRAFT_480519 [Byssothecium circinans]